MTRPALKNTGLSWHLSTPPKSSEPCPPTPTCHPVSSPTPALPSGSHSEVMTKGTENVKGGRQQASPRVIRCRAQNVRSRQEAVWIQA